jgi:NTE family protein
MSTSPPSLETWLRQGPFTLALSAGFFGFFAHCGLLEALLEVGLVPAAVTGASAGALVGGLWAAGLEPAAIGAELQALRRADFWDPWPGLGFLRGRLFRRHLERSLPVTTFDACRAPFFASVFDVFARATRVLSTGELAPAIQASCSVPLLFHPTFIGRRPCVDGGVRDRPALAGLEPGARVLSHYLLPHDPLDRERTPPARAGMTALVLRGLPRVHPFGLAAGPLARVAACEATRRALKLPLAPLIELDAGGARTV